MFKKKCIQLCYVPSPSIKTHLSANRSLGSLLLLSSCSVVSGSLRPHRLQHARLPCPSPTPGTCSNSRPPSQWCHPATSSSVALFSFCPQTFPASESFPVSWLFASGGQRIGASASSPVLSMNIQDWFLLVLTGLISLLSKGLSGVFSSTTVWKHQFSGYSASQPAFPTS